MSYSSCPSRGDIRESESTYSSDVAFTTRYPHGRMTKAELKAAVLELFDLDEGAAYSGIVGGNTGNPNE